MYRGAIGIIETRGQIGSVEAADAMTKSAAVELVGREDLGAGFHSVVVRGDVGSVRAALASGGRAASQVGELLGMLLIPRPHDDVQQILPGPHRAGSRPRRYTDAELSGMNVPQLRNLARDLSDLSLRGREISRANREQLLSALRERFGISPAADGEA